MTLALQMIGVAVLFVGLPLAFAWIFKFIYGFFQPLDQAIRMDRLREFEFAGAASGLIMGWMIMFWWMH